MKTTTRPSPNHISTDEPDWWHLVDSADDEYAYCGTYVADAPWTDGEEMMCPMCDAMDNMYAEMGI